MLNTRLTMERLKTHFEYGKWIYIAIALAAYFVGDLLFTMTEYRPPAERKVDFQIVGYIGNTEPVQAIADSIMEDAASIDPELEQITVYGITYSGDAETDIYGAQKFTVMIAAQDGAVYIMNRQLVEQLAFQGALLPLDGYIEDGTLDATGLDLSGVTLDEPTPDDETPATGKKYVYAIPCTDLIRLTDADISYDISDAYITIMAYCKNPDTAAKVTERLRNQLRERAPAVVVAEAEDAVS